VVGEELLPVLVQRAEELEKRVRALEANPSRLTPE